MRALNTKYVLAKRVTPILEFLQSDAGLSVERASELVQQGAVWVKSKDAPMTSRPKRCTDINLMIQPDDFLRVHTNPKRFTEKLDGIDWGIRVLADFDDFVLINKPAGIPSHPTIDNLYQCVPSCLKPYVSMSQGPASLAVLHRLDVDTQGLMVS